MKNEEPNGCIGINGVSDPNLNEVQLNQSKKETLEEVAERFTKVWFNNNAFTKELFIEGVKWQQDRSYSEEEVLEFTQTIIQQYKFGNTNIEQLDLLKETLQLFKNK